jgi:hypothetical protein
MMSEDENTQLKLLLSRRLQDQTSDPEAADRLAKSIFDVALTWRPDETPVQTVDTIIAFALGLREEVPDEPMAVAGPVNEDIAASVVALANQRPGVRIYAQWEIARVLHGKYNLANAVSIERQSDENGQLYLSTWGVAQQAIDDVGGDPSALGKVAVMAHTDHAWRCVNFCRALGIDAYVASGISLATGYDPLSVQPFTITADNWLIYDLALRVGGERQRILGF